VRQRERAAALEAVADEIAVCQRCRLHKGRTRTVPGEGHPSTEVAFVGEGPGFHEDQQGRPFVGAAGRLLEELLKGIGWRREEVFITNVVKCRPPENRDPEPDEIAACAPFLRRQLEALDPAVVVTLGRHSLETFRPGARISQAHGTVTLVPDSTGAVGASHLALYHPAAGLRSTAIKDTLVAESATIPAILQDARARRASIGPRSESAVVVDTVVLEMATAESSASEPATMLSAAEPLDEEQMGLFR
jgi:uracil-DNA glycosylase family 4